MEEDLVDFEMPLNLEDENYYKLPKLIPVPQIIVSLI